MILAIKIKTTSQKNTTKTSSSKKVVKDSDLIKKEKEVESTSLFKEETKTFFDESNIFYSKAEISNNNSKNNSYPLSVLLPPLGDVNSLVSFKEKIENRLSSGDFSKTSEDLDIRGGETLMLKQVLQWLSLK